jgi:hypothetical protein
MNKKAELEKNLSQAKSGMEREGDQARALSSLNYPHNQQQRSINRPHSLILKTTKRCAYF